MHRIVPKMLINRVVGRGFDDVCPTRLRAKKRGSKGAESGGKVRQIQRFISPRFIVFSASSGLTWAFTGLATAAPFSAHVPVRSCKSGLTLPGLKVSAVSTIC